MGNNLKFVGALALVVLLIYGLMSAGGQKYTAVTRAGEKLSIMVGKNHFTAREGGPEKTMDLLVVGGSGYGDKFFTCHFSVIPMSTVAKLAEKYGNFRRCNSPGASAGKKATRAMFLYAETPEVEKKLREIDDIAMSFHDCVIEMTCVKLKMLSHKRKWRGKEVSVDSSGIGPNFLVKDVRLIEKEPEIGSRPAG
ncbi:MAG: hypothetical protein KGZ25_00025 [Planctomycetes bacterium]|nr:hypothetical protein [Planctomycetota bacterium]